MSLVIGIGDGRSIWPVEGEPKAELDDDGYYWFLHPLFWELAEETGQYVDLYGNASFEKETLSPLENMLSSACKLVGAQPETWEVQLSPQAVPEQRELYSTVERGRFLELLAQLNTIVARSRKTGRPVVCRGD
jgi:hypothetical protein